MHEKASIGVVVREFILKNKIFVVLILAGLILCLVGLFQYLSSNSQSEDIQFISSEESVEGVSDSQIEISVDVAGSVQKPGVYQLKEGARIQEALIAAGGLSSKADRGYISKRLNLAQKLTDGAKIYIPTVGEFEEQELVSGSNPVVETVSTDAPVSETGLININNASQQSLETLPRIGPVTAQKIINGRPYGTIEDLVSKKVLGQKTFDGLRDMIIAQ
jgi:competence protein ComEA